MSEARADQSQSPRDHNLWFGHPKGLYVLAATEMWERFSYYGMRSLLVFFLTQRFLFSDEVAFSIYGGYTALVYISPIIGGLLADRYLGSNRAVIFGAILMIVGHCGLVLEDVLSFYGSHEQWAIQIFYLALSFLIAGVGLLKPNISTLVGGLYTKEGHLRDSGFTIFVWGINFGAAISAVTCGYVGQRYGWGFGFGLAGLGITFGLVIFLLGKKHLGEIGAPPQPFQLAQKMAFGLRRSTVIYTSVLLSVALIWQLIQVLSLLGAVVGLTFILSLAATVWYGYRRLEIVQRQQLFSTLLLMSVWVLFAALLEQMGTSISLFTERVVDRNVDLSLGGADGGIQIQSAQIQGLLPVFIIFLSPFIAWLWGYLQTRNLNPSTPVKFATALFLMGLGYLAITLGTVWPDAAGKIALPWLIALYFFFAVGDLLIVPVGLSAVTKLASPNIIGFVMGLWMLSVSIGNYMAAIIAGYSSITPTDQVSIGPMDILVHYRLFFACLAGASFFFGVVAIVISPITKKWMHGVR